MAKSKMYPDDQSVYARPKISGRRGHLIWRPYRGLIVVQSLPRYVNPRSLEKITPWIAWLRVQNILFLYSSWRVRVELLRHEALSKVPARDWFMSFARGLVYSYQVPGLGEVFSMAMVERYSRSLDVFGQTRGDLLVRGATVWGRIPVGAEGQVLTVIDGVPAWANPGHGAGGMVYYPAEALYPWSTVRTLLNNHVYTVRLPYLTDGAAALSVDLGAAGAGGAPTRLRAFYSSPSTAVGNVVLYVDAWEIRAEGEPVSLGRREWVWSNSVSVQKWFSHDYDLPAVSTSAIGVSYRIGRSGADQRDTAGDYTYLVGVSLS